MLKPFALVVLVATLTQAGCSSSSTSDDSSTGGGGDSAGAAGSSGGSTASGGSGGAGGSTTGGSDEGGVGGTEEGGASGAAGAAGTGGGGTSGAGGEGGLSGAAGSAGTGGTVGAGGSVNNVPNDYTGTPFKALTIPGTINAADYDRGGAGVAWCHNTGNCGAGTTTGDQPAGNPPPYRPLMPANAQRCGAAACDDNVGICWMNPQKPDNTINGSPMPADATYLCYSVPGEWTKYTVTVTEAGMYSVSGVMAVMVSGGVNLSFGGDITTGDLSLAQTPNTNSGSGENFHSWDDRPDLATVTFPAAGTYLMTMTQVSRFNASSFTFTKILQR